MKKKTVFLGRLFSFLLILKKLIIVSGSALTITALIFMTPESAYADNAVFYLNEGFDKFNKKYFYGAIYDFTKAIEIDPNNFKAYLNRGITKVNLDLPDRAIADFNKAIEINPNHEIAHIKRGFAKYLLKDYEGSITDFNKAIEINPKSTIAYANRGDAKLLLGDIKGHCADYKISASLGVDVTYPKHHEIMQDKVNNPIFKNLCDI